MHLFNRIKFTTPESVEIEFTLAGIGSRALALMIDYVILAFTLVITVLIWSFIFQQVTDFGVSIFGPNFGLWLIAISL
ncbi:MAG: RDD family protein, partial [Aphanizomenon sp.]